MAANKRFLMDTPLAVLAYFKLHVWRFGAD